MTGHLALILHAHLPFVRHPEHDDFLEEDWFFEAITETYIPLLAMMERLVADGVPFRLTMTVTPTLCAMLQDQLLRERYARHLERSIALAGREVDRTRDDPRLRALAEFYLEHFQQSRDRFFGWDGDLIAVFRRLRETGSLELAASSATHALLPLLQQSPEAVRAQVVLGCDSHRAAFEGEPAGFWLPECAYYPGLENVLRDANLRWFVIDAHGLMLGEPRPRRAIYAPCYTPAGPAAFARDRDSSRQVWSATEGYPGDPAYREFYRDIGFELSPGHLWPGIASPIRKFTGIKYHRITDRHGDKELYDPEAAARVADSHATHFLEARRQQLNEMRALDFDPIIVAPFDAELFGHWWFEGPRFLESLIRQAAHGHQDLRLTSGAHYGQPDFQLTTPTEFLQQYPTQQTVSPAASTWGENGHLGVWLDKTNSWIYPHLDKAAERMTKLARAHRNDPGSSRVLKQLARELLLAQASDWAFLIRSGTAKHYATRRVTDHLLRFNRLYDEFAAGKIHEGFLANCEWRDNIFPELDWRCYV
jgi:1,4-alpha-glucan branching enzyme